MSKSKLTIIDGVRFVAVTTKTKENTFNAHVIVGRCDATGAITRIMACYPAGAANIRWQAAQQAHELRQELVKRMLAGDVLQ